MHFSTSGFLIHSRSHQNNSLAQQFIVQLKHTSHPTQVTLPALRARSMVETSIIIIHIFIFIIFLFIIYFSHHVHLHVTDFLLPFYSDFLFYIIFSYFLCLAIVIVVVCREVWI